MTITSTVPAVITALVNTISGAMTGVQVINGQPLNNLQPDFVAVGWDEQSPAIIFDPYIGDVVRRRGRNESYDVICQIVSWRGGANQEQTVLARCFELYNDVQAALLADHTLGGAATTAEVSAAAFTPAQTDKGPIGSIRFTVHVDAGRAP